ncbi:MAG TPA: patatin-like phospholipase family protein [Mycobacteriales bacterium]|jgi:NTE family protein|nr:patatin-like phospholipase family protein [Mycobacteriales bacterium]HVX69952.1 patatin-like phospholipase family protein [Mycobacteriales bacterium]
MSQAAPRRGLVLGGGGVLGAAWMIGALSAVSDAYEWDPRDAEIVVGTSAGSVVGAMLACGLGVETLINHQRGIVAPGDPDIGFDPDTAAGGTLPPRPQLRIGSASLLAKTVLHPRRLPVLAALSGLAPRGRGTLAALEELVRQVNPDGTWPEHPAAWMIAMDYDAGKRVAFGSPGAPEASLSDAVMASCSIPGWFAPIEISGHCYVDGGTLSPTSLDLLAGRGLDEVIVLAPMISFDYDEPSTVVARMERRFRRAMTKRVLREAGKVRRSGTAVTLLGPGSEDLEAIGVNLMDHRRRGAVLDTALRTTAAALAGVTSPSPLSEAG